MSDSIQKQVVPFTQIANEVLNSPDLSFKAKGIYAYMTSKPDGWNFTIRSMAKQVKDGEDGIRSGIKELRDLGFVDYTKHANGTGTYTLRFSMRSPEKNPKRENPVKALDHQNGEIPRRENPLQGKSRRINNKDSDSNKDSSSNKDTHTASQTKLEIIESFYPNEASANLLRELYPNISKRQADDMVGQFKDRMIERSADWKDIQAQFRTYVRKGWVKPTKVNTTTDKVESSGLSYADINQAVRNKQDLNGAPAKIGALANNMRVV